MEPMGIAQILGVAASVSVLSGWRLYLVALATGLAMRYGVVAVPEHLAALKVLTNTWVLSAAGVAAVVEFFADKVPWLDTAWDAVHTAVRPIGGALLTLAVIDPVDPKFQALAFILGGGATLLSHGGKAGARAVLNASPEPFTNVAASTTEDVVTSGVLYLAYAHQVAAGVVALGLLVLSGLAAWWAQRTVAKFFRRKAV